jgi:hypothetical protein
LANFLKGSSRALVSLSDYMAAESRYGGEDGLVEGLPDVLGIDAAWVGQNQTVFCHRKGPVLWKFQRFQGQRTNVTAELVEQWLVAHPHGVAVIEGIGISAGVIDLVIANGLGSRLIVIHPGSPPIGSDTELEQFKDRRSQLYYYLAQRFKDGTLAVREKNLPLGGQLTSIRAQIRGDSKYEVEGKREMLKRMPSPDDADAAMLSMAGSPDMFKAATISDLAVAGTRPEYGDW